MYRLLKLLNEFKDYLVLVVLLSCSLSLIYTNSDNNINGFRALIINEIGYLQNVFNWIPNVEALKTENIALINLNIQLSSEVASITRAIKENQELKNMLQLKQDFKYNLIACEVINKQSLRNKNFAVVNKGTNNGIKNGMAVISNFGLIGTIIATNEKFSMVELLNNKNTKIAATTSESQLNGIINWSGGNYLYMNNIGNETNIKVGEKIITSNFSNKIPSDIQIGTVNKVINEPGSHFFKVYVKPANTFFLFSHLFIVNYIPNTKEMELIKEIEDKIMMSQQRRK